MSAALVLLALLPLLGALLPALARGRLPLVAAVAVLGAALLGAAVLLVAMPAGGAAVVSRPWVTPLDLTLALRLDRLSAATALLVLIGGLGALWRLKRIAGRERLARGDSALVVLLAGLAQALVLAENLLLVVALAELGALAAFALERGRGSEERAARATLYVRSAGALLLLAAALLLADTAGSFEYGSVLAAGTAVRAHALYPLLLVLVLGAAWSRAAEWPWIRWRRAAAGGTGTTAVFNGALLLATGGYLVLRLWPLLGGALPLALVAGGFVALPLLVAVLGWVARGTGAAEEAPAAASPLPDAGARE